ncbi:UDP-4-amino-4,6-dideoxy-N-acetyl-beta-L-altrosamine N-acetyltransferase [Hoeflea prorocentri]|uniref:UDP-4-amino-4, 6-dideoxy-N-acetyl-beta-L-altrosamine N-acetyltransferase n=1 Tax=Hoeflea prorocentri TaxID=1922333 RepID=A0A9X3URA0_9HYPH|nr:UDP-4-amino-4,6-dideoxy-N-acetyl-beta-L-altrosamine N-acetyltransferase [Hoeflea prorocentri]MCY6383766.1 UDP-4-amino-4,6-dideoxy-N-acetyl-beta-L-altrosamine N-acetyltransferase [Hoeflea prorocentri]MDA5401566.1 UDP-4-amino-4,6-dideoxy-N-acetyl-beta-L-altrosamine N-acetyltransferase [Hoeflea prorocentri]
MQSVVLRKIAQCTDEQKSAMRLVRNQPSVRTSMYTDHEITSEEHLAWLERTLNDPNQIFFIVLVHNNVAGAASINAMDRRHKKADWAFYLDENQRGGLGAAIEFALINHVFDDLALEKLNCEVLETNPAVVKMHQKFGFEREGLRRSNVIKNGERIGVHFLGLTRPDWSARRGNVEENHRSVLDRFSVIIEE